jgi:hypothetical protein
MATTAQVLFEAGYARATGNDPGKMAVDGELLNRLNRVFQSIYALAARQRPDEFTASALMTLAGTPATATLASCTPALVDVIDIPRIMGSTGTVAAGGKIHLVPEAQVYRTWQIPPTMFRRGLSLISRGQTGDPVATDVIQLIVLDSPATLSAPATTVDGRFPVRHHEILVNDIALYLNAKDEGRDPAQFAQLQADQRSKMFAFAADYNIAASALEAVLMDRVPVSPGPSAG